MSMDLNHDSNQADKAAFIERLEKLGPEEVRSMMALGMFPTGHNVVVTEWLAEQAKPSEQGKKGG